MWKDCANSTANIPANPTESNPGSLGPIDMEAGVGLKERMPQVPAMVGADKPTQGHVEFTAMSYGPDGSALFKLADTTNMDNPDGFYQTPILGAMERQYVRPKWAAFRAPYPKGRRVEQRNSGSPP